MDLVKKNATQAYESKSEKYSFAAVAQYDWGGKVTAINSGVAHRSDNARGSVSFSASLLVTLSVMVVLPSVCVSTVGAFFVPQLVNNTHKEARSIAIKCFFILIC